MNAFSKFTSDLICYAQSLATEIVDNAVGNFQFVISTDELTKITTMYTRFIKFLGETLTNDDLQEVRASLILWNKKHFEAQTIMLSDVSSYIKPYADNRLLIVSHIVEMTYEYELSKEEVLKIVQRTNYLLDNTLAERVIAHEDLKNKLVKEAREEAHQLSAPIVPVEHGVAVLPLIGAIDTDRAKFILEKAIPRVSELHIDCLIIDFSGIVTIDTEVASHIFRIHHVLVLLGITVFITGIRPGLAQTIVQAGIDLTSIKTFSTVQQALQGKNDCKN